MPSGFSEKEKIIIRQRLFEEGKILFGSYGLKKTGKADLTRSVGPSTTVLPMSRT